MARLYAFTFPAPLDAPRHSATPIRNLLRRLLDAIIQSRSRRAQREIQTLVGHDFAFADFARHEGLDPRTTLPTTRHGFAPAVR
jgi:hypothetical protein